MMTFEGKRMTAFSYQSSVHSCHVLLCLNEQRNKNILCDATVVVEDRSFRAHRSVLAASSDYFQSRVTGHADQVITLPKEVTVEGFDPLLQFAYTSKLLLTKENILEIRNCAQILGFRNLDKACFDFLIPKFFEIGQKTTESTRKICCKSKCWKEKLQVASSFSSDDVGEELLDLESPEMVLLKKTDVTLCSKSSAELPGACRAICTEGDAQADYSSQCPKYRKFQNACGKDRPCLESCAPQMHQFLPTTMSEQGMPSDRPCGIASLGAEDAGDNNGINESEMEEQCKNQMPLQTFDSPDNGETTQPSHSQSLMLRPPAAGCFPADCLGKCPDSICSKGDGTLGDNENLQATQTDPAISNLPPKDQTSCGERSSVEREVAEHLAKGFWSELCPSQTAACNMDPDPSQKSTTGKNLECHWLAMNADKTYEQLDLNATMADCPFLRDLGTDDCCEISEEQNAGCGGASQQEKSPYISSVNSGDDSDFDTEGDSESYTRERAQEVQLPFSVEKIASLSRNDFQQMLKVHKLTREQLDFVHDIRRRSKNRIAAQRCRKRKLDCIQNLESEIDKLRNEKDRLLLERNQLKMSMGETWQNLSGLCHKVCSEAALTTEQLQVLAKYTSPDCPFSLLITPDDSPSTWEQGLALSCLAEVSVDAFDAAAKGQPDSGHTAAQQPPELPTQVLPRSADGHSTERCCHHVITDFCLEMTNKCTTDE
ncbi:transcription regulator protein BACH1b [Amia ocellicauda]|uniref:transcription regulator protein BACH1b n=1 Tax=Amia ocellicauda TaxID=2972642 RepID=UPI0034640315